MVEPVQQVEAGVEDTLAPTPPTRPDPSSATLLMLADAPVGLRDDKLGYADYADALAGLIHNPSTHTPLTLAINAPWGAGKSSLARMVRESLEEKARVAGHPPHVVCEFNAWMHDEADDLATALTAAVAQTAGRARAWWLRVLNPLPLAFARPGARRWRRVWLGAALLVLVGLFATLAMAFFGSGEGEAPGDALSDAAERPGFAEDILTNGPAGALAARLHPTWLLVAATVLLALFSLRMLLSAAQAVGNFISDPKAEAAAGSMPAVRDQLGKLVAQATRGERRFVLFVDDLERVRPPKSVDALEAVNQLLPHEGVAVVVLADVPAVAACAEVKYADLAARYDVDARGEPLDALSPQRFGRRYLQKIFQLQFDLPPQTSRRMHDLLRDLAREDAPAGSPEPSGPAPMSLRDDLTMPFRDPVAFAWRGPEAITSPLVSARDFPPARRWKVRLAWWFTVYWRWSLVMSAGRGKADAPPDTPAWRRRRRAARVAMLLAVPATLVAFLAMVFVASPLLGDSPTWPTQASSEDASIQLATGAVLYVLIVGPLLIPTGIVRAAAKGRKRQRENALRLYRAAYDAYVRGRDTTGAAAAPPPSPEPPEDLDKETATAVAREREQRHLADDSPLLEQASEEVVRHHPTLPRNAKRLLNRLRLLLFVAQARGMLRPGDAIGARHVGKWAVLEERWPELAQAVVAGRADLAALEDAARQGAGLLSEALHAVAPAHAEDASLSPFLAEEPRLSPHVARLLAFEPQAPRTVPVQSRA